MLTNNIGYFMQQLLIMYNNWVYQINSKLYTVVHSSIILKYTLKLCFTETQTVSHISVIYFCTVEFGILLFQV